MQDENDTDCVFSSEVVAGAAADDGRPACGAALLHAGNTLVFVWNRIGGMKWVNLKDRNTSRDIENHFVLVSIIDIEINNFYLITD